MNTVTAAIANHLNVAASAIVEVQEWARVLWVRVKGLGARFVSKKVTTVEIKEDWIKVNVACESVVAERNSNRAFVLRPGYDMGNAYLVKEIPMAYMKESGFSPRMVHYDRVPSTGEAVTVPAIVGSITAATIEERALQALHCAPCW